MMYYIEEGRWGEDWERVTINVSNPDDFNNLDAMKYKAKQLDDHGKYEIRVIDSEGNVYFHRKPNYEPSWIDIADETYSWLESMRNMYGIDESLFKAACEAWLAK